MDDAVLQGPAKGISALVLSDASLLDFRALGGTKSSGVHAMTQPARTTVQKAHSECVRQHSCYLRLSRPILKAG